MQKVVIHALKKKTYFKASKNVEDKYLHLSHTRSLVGEGNGTPLQYSCLENPMDGGAW